MWDGRKQPESKVRTDFNALRDLNDMKPEARGWTLDVLRVVESLGKKQFGLDEVYAFEKELAMLHPTNRHVRDKIRQQLQVLRDLGRLTFGNRGEYALL